MRTKYEEMSKDKIVVLDFYADWCGPCKMVRPILENIAKTNEDIEVIFVNIEDEEELAKSFDVMSVPSIFVFKEGKETNFLNSFLPEPMLIKEIRK